MLLRVRFGFRSKERERGTFARESCDDEKERLKRSTTLYKYSRESVKKTNALKCLLCVSPRIIRCSLLLDSLLNSVLILLLQNALIGRRVARLFFISLFTYFLLSKYYSLFSLMLCSFLRGRLRSQHGHLIAFVVVVVVFLDVVVHVVVVVVVVKIGRLQS